MAELILELNSEDQTHEINGVYDTVIAVINSDWSAKISPQILLNHEGSDLVFLLPPNWQLRKNQQDYSVMDGENHLKGNIKILSPKSEKITAPNISNCNLNCFTKGTLIRTDKGDVPIENLRKDDQVQTLDRGMQAIRWIGSNSYNAIENTALVRVKKGALENEEDLLVTRHHRLLISDWRARLLFDTQYVFVAARHLIDEENIHFEEHHEIEIYHMIFDDHEVIYANGAAAESFHPSAEGAGMFKENQIKRIDHFFPDVDKKSDYLGIREYPILRPYEITALFR